MVSPANMDAISSNKLNCQPISNQVARDFCFQNRSATRITSCMSNVGKNPIEPGERRKCGSMYSIGILSRAFQYWSKSTKRAKMEN
jgi:hypothetical protein